MKFNSLCTTVVAVAAVAAAAPVQAVDTGVDWLKISGFGTLALTRANIDTSSTAYFNGNYTSPKGAQDKWTGNVDSVLGIQAVAQINPSLSATLQVVDKYNYEGSYQPVAEWANLKYQFTPDISVRVGRVGLPAFLISDYLNVGYSHPWLRPPVGGYANMPITHVDGADATFRFHAGETTISVQPAVGKSSFCTVSGTAPSCADAKELRAFNVMVENGAWTARYGNVRYKFASLAVPLTFDDNFSEYGLMYDKDAWLIQGEFITRRTSPPHRVYGVFDQNIGYITAGYRIGKFMPNVTFNRYIDKTSLGQHSDQDTTSLGVRWDFYKNMALKAQFDHITRPTKGPVTPFGFSYGYTGQFNVGSVADAFRQSNKAVNVLGIGLDFVF